MQSPLKKTVIVFSLALGLLTRFEPQAMAQSVALPSLNIGITNAQEPSEVAKTLQIVFVLTVLTLAPSILILMTSFTRIIIVFAFLRHALGTQQMPSSQILIGLALFLTFFIMSPVWQKINESALQPYFAEELSAQEALQEATIPLRQFMLKQTRKKDLSLLISIAKEPRPKDSQEVSMSSLVPAFVMSELQTAFQIGFLIYIPFLILDMVVACVLLSMGMLMLPPIMVSLPFKLLLFVLVDGWNLMVGSLVKSFY
jgi:flagellar biosynthetic protein FliP